MSEPTGSGHGNPTTRCASYSPVHTGDYIVAENCRQRRLSPNSETITENGDEFGDKLSPFLAIVASVDRAYQPKAARLGRVHMQAVRCHPTADKPFIYTGPKSF